MFEIAEAQALLEAGIRRGMVSTQVRGGWPQNVWAVTDQGIAVEAMLDGGAGGNYHGYPLQHSDPLRPIILREWNAR